VNNINVHDLVVALRAVAVAVPFDQQWFDLDQLAAYLCYSKTHVEQRVLGLPGFPESVKCGSGKRWRARDVCKWLESQTGSCRPRKSASG
jgi:predicted DNA-binding transcriptional regulator AlpA